MICKEKQIAELLPWFVNDTLPTQEKKKLKQHLQSCFKCQAELAEMNILSEQLKKYDRELLSQHILAEKLVNYAEAPSELSTKDINFIDAHLKTCSQCQQELHILEKVNQSLKQRWIINFIAIIRAKIDGLLLNVLMKPALAYIFILLLLYPAYLGIFKLNKLTAPNVAQQNYELFQFDNRAGSESTNEIRLTPQTDIFSLSFNLPVLMDENISYDVKILNSDKKVVWQKKNIKSLDEYGTFLVICYSRFFTAGFYTIQINEINRKQNRVHDKFIFSFKIIKEK